MAETRAYATQMIETVSPGSLRETRWQIYRDLHQDIGASVRASEELIDRMSREKDYVEGVQAYMGKRKPQWKGE